MELPISIGISVASLCRSLAFAKAFLEVLGNKHCKKLHDLPQKEREKYDLNESAAGRRQSLQVLVLWSLDMTMEADG